MADATNNTNPNLTQEYIRLGNHNLGALYSYGWDDLNDERSKWASSGKKDGDEILVKAKSVGIVIGDRERLIWCPEGSQGFTRRHIIEEIVQFYVDIAVVNREPDDDEYCTANGGLNDMFVQYYGHDDYATVHPSLDY